MPRGVQRLNTDRPPPQGGITTLTLDTLIQSSDLGFQPTNQPVFLAHAFLAQLDARRQRRPLRLEELLRDTRGPQFILSAYTTAQGV